MKKRKVNHAQRRFRRHEIVCYTGIRTVVGRVWRNLPDDKIAIAEKDGEGIWIASESQVVPLRVKARYSLGDEAIEVERGWLKSFPSLRHLKRAARKIDPYWKTPGVTRQEREEAHRKLNLGHYDWADV